MVVLLPMMWPLRLVTLFLLPSARKSLCHSKSRLDSVSQLSDASHPRYDAADVLLL
jgi:hypothetical protein